MQSVPEYSPEELEARRLESRLAERLNTAGPVAIACLRTILTGIITTEDLGAAIQRGVALLRELDQLQAAYDAAQRARHRRTRRGKKP